MGKKKVLQYFGNSLRGEYLTEEVCKRLDVIYSLAERNGYLSDLRHCIYELSNEDVENLINTGGMAGVVEKRVGRLKDHQTLGVAFAYLAGRLVLGDSVGLGKTVVLSGLINKIRENDPLAKYLFLTEKTLVNKTRRKLIKFTGEYAEELGGTKGEITKFWERYQQTGEVPNIVGSHSLMKHPMFHEFLMNCEGDIGGSPFELLVVDESSVLANTSSQMYKDACQLRGYFNRVVLLNATAFETKLRDYYGQINFVDPTLLPTKTAFSKEFEVYDYRGFYPRFLGKYKNQEKFAELVKYRCFRRTRRELGASMEGCSAKVITVPLTQNQRKLLKLVSMPQMVYDCPQYFVSGMVANEKEVPKYGAVAGVLENEAKGAQVLVYTYYKEAQKGLYGFLTSRGYSCQVLNGDSSREERDSTIQAFEDKKFRVLITNVQKGLDFGEVDHAIFYTSDSNPNKMVQFEGRMTRSFDINNKHSYVLCTEGDELKRFNSTIAERAKASDDFVGNDFSMVLTLLAEGYEKQER